MIRSLFVSGLGNLIEWYDFTLFIYLSTTIAALFFPNESKEAALIATLTLFAGSFLVRPLGGLFFGHIADRQGRTKALSLSTALMAVATLGIAFLPTFSSWGIAAPISLALLRMLQGFSVGGEYTSSILFLSETAPEKSRGFASSFALVGAGFGWALASLSSSFFTALFPPEIAWRLPFLLGATIAIPAFILRRASEETPHYEEAKRTAKLSANPIKELLYDGKRTCAVMIAVNMLSTVAGYFLYAFMPTYLHLQQGMLLEKALLLNFWILLLFNALVPIGGWLSDRYGRLPLMKGAALAYIFTAAPLLLMMKTFWGTLFAWGTLTCYQALYHGALPAWMAESFPVRVRGSGVSLAYNFAASLFSGTAPLLILLLSNWSDTKSAPAYYVILAGCVSFLALYWEGRRELQPLPSVVRVKD